MIVLCKAFSLKLYQLLRHASAITVLGVITGCCLLGASFLPWINDPLGEVYSAWQLPLHLGWFDHASVLNYGCLCLYCALYAFFAAWTGKRFFKVHANSVWHPRRVFLLAIIPVMLLLFQYLCVDIAAVSQIARHERELLLIQQHLGYQGSTQLIPLNLLTLQASTFVGKLRLLLNCISYGPLLLLCAAGWFLCGYRRPKVWHMQTRNRGYRRKMVIAILCVIGLVVLLVRAPAGMLCEYIAKEVIAAGNYNLGLNLLQSARFLNADFEQVAYYHIERGKAQYYLFPTQLTSDSRIYLASAYRIQGDYLDAYQQLLMVWQKYPTAPWVVDEMSTTLEGLAEARRPLRSIVVNRIVADDTTLPWLHTLLNVEPANHYALYMAGRIQYDLHNYQACNIYMSSLLHLSGKETIRSSAYTYMALSEVGLHNYSNARLLLFNAIALDPSYRNTTAREELSGLH